MKWEYRERLGIQNRMIEVVKLAKTAAEKELEAARRKLRKLQYGG